jgi:prepilin-type N-terminal cleavage/methylation domain-containing protein
MTRRRGFTLIELLTVMAITAVLLGIILVPLIQSFNLTRTAQAYSNAQATARNVAARLVREIQNGTTVRDDGPNSGAVAVVLPGQNGALEEILLPYAKIDIVQPSKGDPSAVRDGAFVNPETGKADPTLPVPKGQPNLPATPGLSILRYWTGLKNPLAPNGDGTFSPGRYQNPYDGLLMARSGEADNLCVLWRAEVPVYRRNPGNGLVEPNTELFEFDAAGQPILDDPFFFVLRQSEVGTPAGAAKAARIQAWQRFGSVVTELNRFDCIQPIYDKATRQVAYDGNVPRIVPLVQFRPTSVSRESAQNMESVRLGQESDAMADYAADVFRTKFGLWSAAVVRHYGSSVDSAGGYYQIARYGTGAPGYSIFAYNASGVGSDMESGVETFDLSAYESAVVGGGYPFAVAVGAANGRSGWLGNQDARNVFAPFTVNAKNGRVLSSFGVEEVGAWHVVPDLSNWPLSVAGDPVGPAGAGSNPDYTDPARGINNAYNKAFLERPSLRPLLHRFIDLRVSQGEGGLTSPLHPTPTIGFAKARIVPGSDIVFGPDQTPGPGYGRLVRYTRVTGEPGPNQYRINYTDLAEPTDYSLFGLANPSSTYDSGQFESAVFQPRFKRGYVQLNSDPANPLPSGNILVYYRFQFTERNDVFEVDYDTRQVITVSLTIRSYPQSNLPEAQTVSLTSTATVRNLAR